MPLPSPYDSWFPDSEIDGTYGRDLPSLLAVPPSREPVGFAALWRRWYTAARAVPADVTSEPLGRHGTHDVSLVTFTADGGLRLRAWLAVPVAVAPTVGIVHGHGYGGRDAPTFDRVPQDAAVIFPVARGLGALNAGVGAPSMIAQHVVAGIEDVETYVLGRCAVDLWHAANALVEVLGPPLPLYYVGTSFGGGVGALAAAWDERFVGATLEVPSFGQYDERLAVRCTGSGEAQRLFVAAHPQARGVLAFHDASAAARHLRVPVRVECALWDAHVPPPGQFGVANAVAAAEAAGSGARLELAVHRAGHAEYPGITREKSAAFRATHDHIARSVRAAVTRAAETSDA